MTKSDLGADHGDSGAIVMVPRPNLSSGRLNESPLPTVEGKQKREVVMHNYAIAIVAISEDSMR